MSSPDKPASSKRKLIILLLAAVTVLVAGICLLMLLPEREPDDDETIRAPAGYVRQDMLVFDEDLSAVIFMPEGGKQYTVSIDWDAMMLILEGDDIIFPGDVNKMDELIYGATMLTGLMLAADDADDEQLALFGFDIPRLVWQLVFESGRTEDIELGGDLPADDGSYVRLRGSRDVYFIGGMQRDFIFKPLEDVYDISFLPVPPSTEDEPTWMYINAVRLERSGEDAIEVLRRSSEELAEAPLGTSVFRFAEPFENDCNDYMIQTIFMEPATFIQPGSVIAVRPADLSQYGLDNPAVLTASLATTVEEDFVRTLLIGRYDDALGGRYVMIEGHEDAVLLDKSGGYGFLDVDPYQLRQRIVWLHMIDTVASVEFELDGITRVLELDHSGEEMEGSLDGIPLSLDNARRLYTSALNIMSTGGTDAPVPGVPATYKITINLVDGRSEAVELFPISDSQFLIVHNGTSTNAYITRQMLFANLLVRFDILDAGGDLSRG